MGLFSLFRKNGKATERDPAQSRQQRDEDAARLAANSEAERQDAQLRQREIARATALKIDEIEAAMAFDIFNTPEPAWGSGSKRHPRGPTPAESHAAATTLAQLETPTTVLLSDEELPAAPDEAQTAPIVEEIAILYANNQLAIAEQMLVGSLAEAGADRTVWWMLFDLYQVTGQQEQFDNLSIDYASKFETSPPGWASVTAPTGNTTDYAGVTPTLAFTGVLDAAIAPSLARMEQLANTKPVLRLEFNQVTGVDPAGSELLLHSLKRLQAGQHELIVVAAAELAELIGATLEVGHRDDNEACWLLWLELLQLLNREKEFEEASMDYCVTFEVSPPPFIAPSKVATAAKQYAKVSSADRFLLPVLIEGPSKTLLDAVSTYATQDGAVVLDCSRLTRIDFTAAGLLLKRLQVPAEAGKRIEFRDLNHLVAALLRLMAFSDIAKLVPHKY